MRDSGSYGLLDLKNDPMVTLSTGGTPIGLDGFVDPESAQDPSSLMVFPAAPVASGQTYLLTVQGGVGVDGQRFLQPASPTFPKASPVFTMSFATQGLAVVGQTPLDPPGGDAMAPVTTSLQLLFTAPADPTTFTATSAPLTAAGSPSPVAGTWNPDPSVPNAIDFVPASTLAPATTYTIHLAAGVIKDTGGAPLPTPYSGSFTTL
jgi:hypothetical protein